MENAQHPPVLTRAEYAERAKAIYQLTPAPMGFNALLLILVIVTALLIYGDIGPRTLGARLALGAVPLAVIVGGLFLIGHQRVRRSAGRLGLLCPSCGQYPLGIRSLRYTAKAQVVAILERGRCERCGQGLFLPDTPQPLAR